MKPPVPSISVTVDPTNPGQFFACCGLLELADRLWPGAEGWFGYNEREFLITFTSEHGTLRELLAILVNNEPVELLQIEPDGPEVKPLIAPLKFTLGQRKVPLILDAWVKVAIVKGIPAAVANPPWNFWSGQQTSYGIWSALRRELVVMLEHLTAVQLDNLFSQRVFQKGRFGFDPGPAWNALDCGFSPNEQSIDVESSPVVELLAAVGIQRFRPVMNDDRSRFLYNTWNTPLPPSVAASVVSGVLLDAHTQPYHGCVVSRGSYAALGFSVPCQSGANDD